MFATFFGVRGSYSVPGPNSIRYGGNTTCISIWKVIDGKIVRIIFDSGNGIIPLGKEMIANFFAKKEDMNATICFTHLHPDHTQGFPFFGPNFFPNCKLHLMGMKTLKMHIGRVLELEMLPPTFPIEYKDLKSTRTHYELKDGQTFYVNKESAPVNKADGAIFEVKVLQSYAPSHPQQGALYFRVKDIETGKVVSCLWDLESHYGGDRRVISFAKDSDVIIHDTQYTDEEYTSDKMVVQGFGHSTYNMAIENAVQANAKSLVCMHYNPNHTDDFLDNFSSKLIEENKDKINIIFSKEGQTLEI